MAGIGAGTDHILMVGLDGIMGGYTGHDSFHAAGIAGKIMVFHIACQNAAIRFRHGFENVHGSTVFAGAHMDALLRITVHAFDAAVNVFPYQPFHFFFRLFSVGAKAEDHRNVLILYPCLFQFFHHAGNHDPGRRRPGHVAGYDNHLFPGLHDFRKSGRSDRMSQRPLHLCRLRFHRRTLLHRMMAVIHVKRYIILEILNLEFHSFHLLLS